MDNSNEPDGNINSLVRANFCAQLADQLSLTAISLVAVLYLELGAGRISLLNMFQTLPYLILSIPLGVLVDRVSKRAVMLGAETIRISALLFILLIVYFDAVTFWNIAIFGTLAAFGSVGFNAALPAYVPMLVEKARFALYNGRLELMRSISVSIGPAIAGALAAWFGASNTFVLSVVMTALTIVFVGKISLGGKVDTPDTGKSSLSNIADGAAFITQNIQLSVIMLVAFIWNCGWFVLQAAFMLVAINTWGLSTEVVGYALGSMGIGLLLGSYFSQRIIKALGFGAALAFGPTISFIASMLILANLSLETAILPAIAFFLFGFGPVIWVITSTTLRQVLTPAHMLGCVSAMYLTANWGARPFGALIGVAVGTYFGEIMCFIVSAVLFFTQMVLVFVLRLNQGDYDIVTMSNSKS